MTFSRIVLVLNVDIFLQIVCQLELDSKVAHFLISVSNTFSMIFLNFHSTILLWIVDHLYSQPFQHFKIREYPFPSILWVWVLPHGVTDGASGYHVCGLYSMCQVTEWPGPVITCIWYNYKLLYTNLCPDICQYQYPPPPHNLLIHFKATWEEIWRRHIWVT